LVRVLESPEDDGGLDQFGREVAFADGLLAVGAKGLGNGTLPGRAFVFDANDWSLVGHLAAPSDFTMGDSVAIAGDVVVVGGNDYDGVIHVFERDAAASTTTTSLAPPLATTTTTAVPVSTTTTTVPSCSDGCDDGDACTLDAGVEGACIATPLPALETARCRLHQRRAETACAPSRVAGWADARLREMLTLLDEIERGAARARRIRRRFARHAARYCRHVEWRA
jgi:hypothetical protein